MADNLRSLAATDAIARQADGTDLANTPVEDRPAVASTDLLQGQKTVDIHHNGAVYRLQATRLGKLILTK